MNGPAIASASAGVNVGSTASGNGNSPVIRFRQAACRASTATMLPAAVYSSGFSIAAPAPS